MRPIAVTLVFGGPSRERDISAGSLKPWVTYLSDEPGVSLTVVFVDPDLRAWRLPERYAYTNTCADFADDLAPGDRLDDDAFDALLRAQDLVVPVLHGAYGEDGVFQRRLEALGVRFLFSGPDGLAASFDKARTYEVLAAAGFPVPVHRVVGREALDEGVGALHEWVEARLCPATIGGRPRACAVKPARSGSSYGVTLAAPGEAPLADAVRCALEHDDRVLVEEILVGTEFSVLVIDGDDGTPHALAPTEVRARSEVYDTRQKYLHGAGALLDTPMRDASLVAPVRDAARRAYEALGLRHLARVDGFVVDGRVFVTDVNGISGMGFSSFVFLQTSMVGLSHRQLVRRLVERGAGRPIEDAGAVGERAPAARRVHLLFGGATSERQVSRQSGIFAGLCLLASGHDVRFHLMGTDHRFTEIGLFLALHHDVEEIEDRIRDPERRAAIARLADEIREELGLPRDAMEEHLRVAPSADLAGAVAGADAVFLALHGGVGENGTIQAALELLGVPYNGCGPAASALCADKWALLETVAARGIAGVRTPRHERIDRLEMLAMLRRVDDDGWDAELETLRRRLDAPAVVVKPRSDGCSTGVKLLRDGRTMRTFLRAVVELRESVPAGEFGPGSREIVLPRPIPADWMLEEAIVDDDASGKDHPPGSRAWFDARRYVELTCAVVERDGRLVCATPTIALSADDELSLEEKFQQGVGTNLLLSCFVDAERVALVRRRIEAIAEAAGIAGFARIDCFLDTRDDSLVLIEVNTLPGMTEATVFYTQVLDAFGWSPARVLTHLAAARGGRGAARG